MVAGAKAVGVDGIGSGAGAYIAGASGGCDACIIIGGCEACIGGAYDGDAGGAYEGDGDRTIDGGSGSAIGACIGGGAYDGDGDASGIGVMVVDAGSGGGSVGERGFDDIAGGAIDGARGASGALPVMRVVAGATLGTGLLTGGLLTGGLLSTYVSSCEARATSASASGAGGFAAGATPSIVLLMARRAGEAPAGRGIRDASALGFRPSDPKTAPMRKL